MPARLASFDSGIITASFFTSATSVALVHVSWVCHVGLSAELIRGALLSWSVNLLCQPLFSNDDYYDENYENDFDALIGAPWTRCALLANKFCFSDALEANVEGEEIICGSAMLDDGDATDNESGARAFVINYYDYDDDDDNDDAFVLF